MGVGGGWGGIGIFDNCFWGGIGIFDNCFHSVKIHTLLASHVFENIHVSLGNTVEHIN